MSSVGNDQDTVTFTNRVRPLASAAWFLHSSPSVSVPVVHFHFNAPEGKAGEHTINNPFRSHSVRAWASLRGTEPVVVAVAERSDWDFKGLPNRVQGVLHHLRFVTDGVPDRHRTKGWVETRVKLVMLTFDVVCFWFHVVFGEIAPFSRSLRICYKQQQKLMIPVGFTSHGQSV